jgi:hypothetical protein
MLTTKITIINKQSEYIYVKDIVVIIIAFLIAFDWLAGLIIINAHNDLILSYSSAD